MTTTRRPAPPTTPPATPAAASTASTPDPKKAKDKKGALEDALGVSITTFMPNVVKLLLDIFPEDSYETMFQDHADTWKKALPIINYLLRRTFNAPELVDELSTEFFAELGREITIRAGNEPDESKTGKEKTSTSAAPKATRNLIKHLLAATDDIPKYAELIAGKDKKEARKIELLLDRWTPEELTAFFAMSEEHMKAFLATFVIQGKSFGEQLAEFKSWLAGLQLKNRATIAGRAIGNGAKKTVTLVGDGAKKTVAIVDAGADKTADALADNITDPLANWVDKRNNRSWLAKFFWR